MTGNTPIQTIVLIDYESVGDATLAKVLQLEPKYQRILLLIGAEQHAQDAAAAFITKALAADKRIDLIKMSETSNNNLDLHLAFYLGKTLAEEPSAEYVIFTKDKKDFDPLVNHLKNRGIKCSRKEFTDKPTAKSSGITSKSTTKTAKSAPKTAPQESATVREAREFLETEKNPPKKRDALVHRLQSHFRITEIQGSALVEDLRKENFIKVDDKDKVSYLTKSA